MALLLDRATIQRLLDMKEAVDLMETAFTELVNQTVNMPQRLVMADAEHAGLTLFMPAHLKGLGAIGIKAVTVFPNNPSKYQIPTTLATIVLLDQETGKALSVMDGGYITAMRTGAVSGAATRALAREDATVAGVLGMGVQARTQLWGMCTVRPIRTALCFSVDAPERQRV
ncbi:MAG: ornithine cyclodeaminase, partial [Dehalococcoidia bacterium]